MNRTIEAIRLMEPRRKGQVVNVASLAGIIGVKGLAAYPHPSSVLVGFTESIRLEFADKGIKLTCVMPGPVDTRMMDGTSSSPLVSMLAPEEMATGIADAVTTGQNRGSRCRDRAGCWPARFSALPPAIGIGSGTGRGSTGSTPRLTRPPGPHTKNESAADQYRGSMDPGPRWHKAFRSRKDLERPPGAETVEAIWRIESARLVARLSRLTGEVGLAEDMAQEAFIAALEVWPGSGIPRNPTAWLMTTARNRGSTGSAGTGSLTEKYGQIAHEMELAGPGPGPEQEVLNGTGSAMTS